MSNKNTYKIRERQVRYNFEPYAFSKKPVETIDVETGEVLAGIQVVGVHKRKDISSFIKCYDIESLYDLNLISIRVLCYMLKKLRFDGTIHISYAECAERLGYKSTVTIAKAVKQLKEKNFICKKSLQEYWINPNMFFRGNREYYYESENDIVVNKKREKKETENSEVEQR